MEHQVDPRARRKAAGYLPSLENAATRFLWGAILGTSAESDAPEMAADRVRDRHKTATPIAYHSGMDSVRGQGLLESDSFKSDRRIPDGPLHTAEQAPSLQAARHQNQDARF